MYEHSTDTLPDLSGTAALEPLDDPPDLDPAPDVKVAAFQAPAFQWRGITLHPFAIARESDWLMHARRIGLPAVDRCIGDPETWLSHAVRLLWFCAHEETEWLSVWMTGGRAAPMTLETMIRDWAARHIHEGDQLAVIRLSLQIYDRAHETRAKVIEDDPADGDDSGNGSGPASLPSTPASSAGPAPASSPSRRSTTASRRSAAGPTSTRTARPMAPPSSGRKPSRKRSRKHAPASPRGAKARR